MSQQPDVPESHGSATQAPPKRRLARLVVLCGILTVLVVALAFAVTPIASHLPFSGSEDRQSRPTPSPTPSPATSATATSTPTSTAPMAGGWYAGASGLGVANGKFEDWLGQPVSIAATWADQDDRAQWTLPALKGEYKNWNSALDIAVGGTVLGSNENYAAAARGAYDARWRAAAKVLADRRRNATGPTFVRPFHEMNGDWYDNWVVTKKNSADFKNAFARYAGILRAAMPNVYIAWSPNFSDHTGLPVDYWYPGDDVVDCVALDYYDDGTSDARVSIAAWNAESDDTDDNGNPRGPEAWRRFAQQHGKPIGFPEWGLKPEGGVDHPEWVKAVNGWMNKHANTATWTLGQDIPAAAAGKVLYSVYFNVRHQGDPRFTIYGAGANPKSAKIYPELRWGNRG